MKPQKCAKQSLAAVISLMIIHGLSGDETWEESQWLEMKSDRLRVLPSTDKDILMNILCQTLDNFCKSAQMFNILIRAGYYIHITIWDHISRLIMSDLFASFKENLKLVFFLSHIQAWKPWVFHFLCLYPNMIEFDWNMIFLR